MAYEKKLRTQGEWDAKPICRQTDEDFPPQQSLVKKNELPVNRIEGGSLTYFLLTKAHLKKYFVLSILNQTSKMNLKTFTKLFRLTDLRVKNAADNGCSLEESPTVFIYVAENGGSIKLSFFENCFNITTSAGTSKRYLLIKNYAVLALKYFYLDRARVKNSISARVYSKMYIPQIRYQKKVLYKSGNHGNNKGIVLGMDQIVSVLFLSSKPSSGRQVYNGNGTAWRPNLNENFDYKNSASTQVSEKGSNTPTINFITKNSIFIFIHLKYKIFIN